MAKFFSYRNVTHNGAIAARYYTEAQVEAKLVELHAAHPGVVFERVEVKQVEDTVTEWRTGQGRAGNSYKVARKVKRLIEL